MVPKGFKIWEQTTLTSKPKRQEFFRVISWLACFNNGTNKFNFNGCDFLTLYFTNRLCNRTHIL
jgi:hypothetical protein